MALTEKGRLFSWGQGRDSSLGLVRVLHKMQGSISDSSIPQCIERYIQAKRFNSVAVENETVRCNSFACGGKHVLAIGGIL